MAKKKTEKKAGKKRKARFPRGSAEAKAWGKRMASARKKCDTAYSKAAKGTKRKAKKKGRKKPRSAAQKAATKRMLAANRHHAHKAPKHKKAAKKHPKRKKTRTAAQKAATARMLAANKRHPPKRKASHGSRKKRRQAAVLGAFRGGPRGGIVVAGHRGSSRCSICGGPHGQRQHYSHKHGPHNKRTGTEHAYFTTEDHIAANPRMPLRVKPPKNIKEAAAIVALEKKTKKKAVFIGPVESRSAKKSRKSWQAWKKDAMFIGPRRASGSIR